MDATTYAVRKVVQNNPIVRELDEVRQREMWQWIWMGVVLVLVLLAWTWLGATLRNYAYKTEELQQALATEEDTTRRLQLEVGVLSSPKRIEDWATGRLHMVSPGIEDAFVLQRVIVPERPPSSVVAAAR